MSLLLTPSLTGPAHVAGDAVAGQVKATVCGACHGANGSSPVPNSPKLAGQDECYLLKQMHGVKDDKRIVLEMTGLLISLNDQDLANIAAYFASQKMNVDMADPNLVAQSEALLRGGKITEGIPACISYHSPSDTGIVAAGFPHLGDQHATYVAKQLTNFREGTRTNGDDTKITRSIVARLSDKSIVAISSYIQGLH